MIGSLNSYSLSSAPRDNLRQLFPAASEWKEDEIGYNTFREQYKISGVLVDQQTPLEALIVFFDTATYDRIERDVKVHTTAGLEPVQKRPQ